MAETQNSEEYKYYMRARPLSIGTVPKGFTRFDEDDIGDKGGRYGAVSYDHPLSEKEVKSYELIPDKDQNRGAQADIFYGDGEYLDSLIYPVFRTKKKLASLQEQMREILQDVRENP